MIQKSRWMKKCAMLLAVATVTVGGIGAWSGPANAAAAAGDHGLLQSLQAKHSVPGSTPLYIGDINFLSAKTGRAVGDGFMIGTSNGGNTFQTIYEGQWNFHQITFSDNVYGWALASVHDVAATYLIATVDGGTTWKRLSASTTNFERIEFISRTQGFGYTQDAAYYTADSGHTWKKITTPANMRSTEFTSKNDGWALAVDPGKGFQIMKTMNGGAKWYVMRTVSYKDASYGQIYAKADQVYALLYGGAGMSQTSYALYASGDQGKQWKRVIGQSTSGGGAAPGPGKAMVQAGPANGTPGNMELVGKGTAYLVGASPAAEKVAVGRTTNAGDAWTNHSAIEGYDGIISFPEQLGGWIAVRNQKGSTLYETTDGGISWNAKFELKTTNK